MSYILDALKRADAERERGAVPGLHAQPVTLSPAEGAVRRMSPAAWAALALAVTLATVVAWQAFKSDPGQTSGLAQAPAQSIAPAPGAPAMPAVAEAPENPPMPSRNPAPAPAPAPSLAAPPATSTSPRAAAPRDAGAAPVTSATRPPAPALRPAASAGLPDTAGPAPREPVPEARLPSRNELPEDIRRSLPNLVVGGSIYSDNPPDRILILNGQLFHEHDTLAPDFVLEQIKPKAAVLSFRGSRFEVPY